MLLPTISSMRSAEWERRPDMTARTDSSTLLAHNSCVEPASCAATCHRPGQAHPRRRSDRAEPPRGTARRARRGALRARRTGSPLVTARFGNGRMFVDARDREIGPLVFATGGYERLYMAAAVETLEHLGLLGPKRTFVDVGSNIGTSTIDALMHFGFSRAVCFEPDVKNRKLLRLNLLLNDLDGRTDM